MTETSDRCGADITPRDGSTDYGATHCGRRNGHPPHSRTGQPNHASYAALARQAAKRAGKQ